MLRDFPKLGVQLAIAIGLGVACWNFGAGSAFAHSQHTGVRILPVACQSLTKHADRAGLKGGTTDAQLAGRSAQKSHRVTDRRTPEVRQNKVRIVNQTYIVRLR